jgi:hypothetical protein
MCLHVPAAAGPVPSLLVSKPVRYSLVSGALKSVEASLAAALQLCGHCTAALLQVPPVRVVSLSVASLEVVMVVG